MDLNKSADASERPIDLIVMPLPLKERIQLAKEHMQKHGHQQGTLWPHQRFALSLGELLAAAERGA